LTAGFGTPLFATVRRERLDEVGEILARVVSGGQVAAAVLHAVPQEQSFTRSFGKAAAKMRCFLWVPSLSRSA